jgi:tetratricopeptide (TPR) repeat protein
MHKRRLDSWKAIAEFLGKSLRTVQRWHELNGLPVHHYGGKTGSVFAYEEEIDAWLGGIAGKPGVGRVEAEQQHEAALRTSRELSATADRMWETRAIGNIQTITELYREAIDKDDSNASAFIGLANALIFSAITDVIDGAIAFPMVLDAIRRIPAIESDSVDAKCPMAWTDLLYCRNWHKARMGFEHVVSMRPSSSFARAGLALANTALGNLDEATECAWKAWRINPLVRSLAGVLCWILYLKGDFQHVQDLTAQMRNIGGYGPVTGVVEAFVLAQDRNTAVSIATLENSARGQPQNIMLQAALGYAYGVAGEERKARAQQTQILRWAESSKRQKGYPLALVSLGLGENHEAISWLETAYAEGSLWTLGFRSDPLLRILKGLPRFDQFLCRLGEPTPLSASSGPRVFGSPEAF